MTQKSVVTLKGVYMDEGLFFDIEPDFVVAGTGEDVITIILVFYLVRAIFRQL